MQKFLIRSLFLVLLLSAAESWALPPCPGSYDNNTWTNCQGTYTDADGNKYVGEWKDGKRHGQGTFTFGPKSEWRGEKYVGEWRDDERHGQGTNIYANGEKYVGEFKANNWHGQGTYTYADGRIEEGVWRENKFLYAQKISPQKAPTVIADDGEAIAAASGTGFAVTRSGHIVTNHHVINGCNDVKVHYEGKIIPATVLSKDSQNDLALLKADFKPAAVLPLSKKNPELMEDVFVAGFPFWKKHQLFDKDHQRDHQLTNRVGRQLLKYSDRRSTPTGQ